MSRRQEHIPPQHKLNLLRQTLARWVEPGADWLKPKYEQIRTGLMAGGYIQVDETRIAYLAPGTATRQAYLWKVCRLGEDGSYLGRPDQPRGGNMSGQLLAG